MGECPYPLTPLEFLKDKEYMDILVEAIHADMYDFKGINSSLQMRRQAKNLILHDAAKVGNVEFLTLFTHSVPELTRKADSKNRYSIFHVAVVDRQGKVFSLIYQTGASKHFITYYIDDEGNNILHLARKLAPPSRLNTVSAGPALQMQRELLWFKEAKKIVRPSYVHMKNKEGKTPWELFTGEHENLRRASEKWMKDTATSCIIVVTLIATVAFAAAFIVPGGNKEETVPELTRKADSKNRYSIFHVAVVDRQGKVFSLIYQTGASKHFITYYVDGEGNNIFHLARKLAPPSRLNTVSAGPALQMQRELLWFKEVKKIVRPSYVHMKNKQGKTPWELFTVEHENLRRASEKWMKDTSTSCIVVVTLIATVTFAATFTIPGGNKEETAKLMVGLITLFASIVCMVVTFSATFFLVYKEEKQGLFQKLIAVLAVLPITLYAVLNCRLWIALIDSTCWASRFMFRPGKHRLFDGDQDID
ncbi:Hypothetical predicted protein [Olea europaea subsp. europaea]|uniref:PGG domain-containing protein n=1 Tax=Olea europaea subsp. europaea TaxID=158383 RepID=A0A8S0QH14_OLEEU|nr:Hypothetical predicted protein [Olea europaea subsp. europaea]